MGAAPEGYIQDLHLSMLEAIRTGLRADSSTEPLAATLQVPGDRAPAETDLEWVAYYPLMVQPVRRPRTLWSASVMIQVTCASRVANVRPDKDAFRPMKIAARIVATLDSKDVPIYEWNDDGSRGAYRGVLSVHEVTDIYLNQRSRTVSSIPGPRLEGVPIDSHATILTIRGVTDARS